MSRGLVVVLLFLAVACGSAAAASGDAQIPVSTPETITEEIATPTVEAASFDSTRLRNCLAVFAWFALRHAHPLSTISSRTEPPYMLPENYNSALIFPQNEPFNALEEYCFPELDEELLTDLVRRTQLDWIDLSD